MATFNKKDIQVGGILGEKLKDAREKSGYTLENVEKKTGISLKHLEALENSNYEVLPGEVYIINFLKVYAQYLELNPEKVVALYNREKEVVSRFKKQKPQEYLGKKPIRSSNFWTTPKVFRNLIIGLLVVIILVYLGMEFNRITSPPFLEVESPVDDLVISEKVVKVSGKTEKESRVTINGQEVFEDEEGNFEEEIDLKEGINYIKITAAKKRSSESVVYKKVLVKENQE